MPFTGQDQDLECADCHSTFIFTAREQQFYESKGFTEVPKRCKPCREERKIKRDVSAAHGGRK